MDQDAGEKTRSETQGFHAGKIPDSLARGHGAFTFSPMQPERIYVGLLLLAGFLWLRARVRRLGESERGRALRGTGLFLVPVLLGGRWAFEKLPFGRYENLAIEMASLAAAIAFVGFVFMSPGGRGEGPKAQ